MSAVLALPQVKNLLKTLAKGKEKGLDQGKEHDVNAHAVTEEGEKSKKPWDEDIPELSSPSYSPPTSFSYSSDLSSSSNPRRRRLPWIRYHGIHEGLDISVVVPGKCIIFGVDNVGTVPSALITYAAVQALHPDLIINMGTAGGFKAKGAKVADAYIATEAANHDRRIPIPIFDEYGIGVNTTIATPNLLQTLRLKEGKLSTGNSLDMTPQDEEIIKSNDATIKDMEVCYNSLVPDILGSADADASSELCRAWDQVRDQQSLGFFDPRARANFITPQLAEKMGIKTDEMGPAYTASMAAPGHEVTVTPLIGKLRLYI
ncbi:hypothetical protein L7F22_028986 [Adiantum nelumboides]|nr:hypothetical protein [Adiantum nelumboides]